MALSKSIIIIIVTILLIGIGIIIWFVSNDGSEVDNTDNVSATLNTVLIENEYTGSSGMSFHYPYEFQIYEETENLPEQNMINVYLTPLGVNKNTETPQVSVGLYTNLENITVYEYLQEMHERGIDLLIRMDDGSLDRQYKISQVQANGKVLIEYTDNVTNERHAFYSKSGVIIQVSEFDPIMDIQVAYDLVLETLQHNDNSNTQDDDQNVQQTKQVRIPNIYSRVITFEIPSDWNVAYNGDPVFVTDLNDLGDRQSIVTSVSPREYPVTYTDLNWEQINFYLTDGNLIDDSFIASQRESIGETVENYQSEVFTGIVSTDQMETDTASKADTGGSTYYLKPLIESPDWNLIIVKLAEELPNSENVIDMILESLSIEYND